MLPPLLQSGDLIGLASPSWLATEESIAPSVTALEALGYRVRLAPQIFAHGWDYAATPEERAESFNALIRDPEVRLVFFGGGEGADDIVPLLDYEAARRDPKLYLSYSDGTSILNAIHAETGASGIQKTAFLSWAAYRKGLYALLSPDTVNNLNAHWHAEGNTIFITDEDEIQAEITAESDPDGITVTDFRVTNDDFRDTVTLLQESLGFTPPFRLTKQ